ncbi:MAG TPA: class II aldolase, partial [Rhodobiaceae bacterium]|nr:class II aldolase [Rhodobiaceae bacterium]
MSVAEDFSGASMRDQVSEAEWQVRVDLAATYRLVAHYGWS